MKYMYMYVAEGGVIIWKAAGRKYLYYAFFML